jgi:activator of HSP90 ATPase
MATLKQYHFINGPAEEVFRALTNSFTIELWSGHPAIMSPEENFEFSLWNGDINGRNIKIIEDELIHQVWYFENQSPPSEVTMKLRPSRTGTSVELLHVNIPEEQAEEMEVGWKDYYFSPLKGFFEE